MKSSAPELRFTTTDWMLALIMCSGIFVSIEPAPFDLAIMAAGVLLVIGRQLRVPPSSGPALVLLLLFAAANVLSLVVMRDQEHGYRFLGITFYLMAAWGIVLAALGKGRERTTDAMFWGIAAGGGVAAATGIAAYLGAPVLAPLMVPEGRLQGLFKDPNVYGAYLVPVALIAIAKLVGRTSRRRATWVAVLGVSIAAILLSFSRGAWVNLGVAMASFFVLFTFANGLSRVWWRTVLLLPVLVVAFGALGYELVSVDAISDMFSMRFGVQKYDHLRFATQTRALEAALQHPLGLGPGSTEGTFNMAAHSTYVRALVENGVLGALSLLAFMVASVGRAMWISVMSVDLQDRLRFAIVAATLIGMFVESGVIDTIHWRHFWIFCAFAWAPSPVLGRRSG